MILSQRIRAGIVESQIPTDTTDFSTTTRNIVKVLSITSLSLGNPISVSQAIRSSITLCEPYETDFKPLIVMGVWLAIHISLAMKFGTAKTYFPGALILPLLYVFGSLNFGIASIIPKLLITAGIFCFLYPSVFKATFIASEWVSEVPEYIERYGFVFEDYRDKRQMFQVIELLFQIIYGYLDSSQDSCHIITIMAYVSYGLYAFLIIVLYPLVKRLDQYYSTLIALLQFFGLLVNDIFILISQWFIITKTIIDIAMILYYKIYLKIKIAKEEEPKKKELQSLDLELIEFLLNNPDTPEAPSIKMEIPEVVPEVPKSPDTSNSPEEVLINDSKSTYFHNFGMNPFETENTLDHETQRTKYDSFDI
jgi:hypothetical protein